MLMVSLKSRSMNDTTRFCLWSCQTLLTLCPCRMNGSCYDFKYSMRMGSIRYNKTFSRDLMLWSKRLSWIFSFELPLVLIHHINKWCSFTDLWEKGNFVYVAFLTSWSQTHVLFPFFSNVLKSWQVSLWSCFRTFCFLSLASNAPKFSFLSLVPNMQC